MSVPKPVIEYPCKRCGVPFDNQRDWWRHMRICTNDVLLKEPEFVEEAAAPTYKSLLEAAANHDPAYKKYANRKDPTEPDGMRSTYMQIANNKEL